MSAIIPTVLYIKSCASLDAEVLKDLEAIEPNRTIAELLDEKTENKENKSEKSTD